MKTSELLNGLTEDQKSAVTFSSGPVLVVAGAGTGKTAVITRRIAFLIDQKLASPEEILALTFTEKAALEMEERVDELVPYGFVDTWISTFHAFGDRILRDHAINLDLPVDYRVLNESEQLMFFREHIFEFSLKHLRPLNNPHRYAAELLRFFSKLKDENITSSEYQKFAHSKLKKAKTKEDITDAEIQVEIANCFKYYNELLHQNGYIDFGDQIYLVIRLFSENPRLLKKYQDLFKYILVDEFQDTNYAQNELLKLLAPGKANLMVVGDDDQSIYQFRGAALSNILDFIKNWPNAKQIVLTKNFRSGKDILAKSYELITQNNPARLEITNNINKKLIASGNAAKNPGLVKFDLSQTISAEADKVAEQIKIELESGVPYHEIAVLVRRNSDVEIFEKALSAKGIASKVTGSRGLYNRPEIITLISFIKAISNPFDNMAHFHLITGEVYGLAIGDAVYLNGLAKRHPGSLEDIYLEVINKNDSGISEDALAILEVYLDDLANYREKSQELTAGQLVYRFLIESGYLKKLLAGANKNASDEAKIQNISEFFENIKGFDLVSTDKSIHNFYNNLEQLLQAGENPPLAEIDPDIEAVNIITIHKAKGLEFEVVFMVNLSNECFPTRRGFNEFEIPVELMHESISEFDTHLEEERRLFYVGMTRAKNKLYLSSSIDHGAKKKYKVSQFVIEALGTSFEVDQKNKLSALEKIEGFQTEKQLVPLLATFYKDGKTLVLTPHQIDDYLSCPLKFKYVHVFKIPLMKNHAIIYGSAIHAAVQYYYESKKQNRKITSIDLMKVFEASWSREGFYTRKHEEERFKQGRLSLEKFFREAETNADLPDKVEEPFSFLIGGNQKRIKVNGRYDAVYNRGDDIEIRDFKTANVKNQSEAEKRVSGNNQVAIYALSWRENYGKIPKVSLFFIDSGLLGIITKNDKQLDKVIENITKVGDGIRAADFSARPGYGECNRCAYNGICPFRN